MMSGVVTSNLVDWTLMQVSSFFLSISLTMFLALLDSWDTNPPYYNIITNMVVLHYIVIIIQSM